MSQIRTGQILYEHADRFEGIGKENDIQVQIHADESVASVAQQHRHISFHMRKKVEDKLKRLEDLNII